MCGITGFVTYDDAVASETVLRRMMNAIAHRGPDEIGVHISRPAYLGHVRLSIIDLATGQQPMTNEDESVWIVYNGEIFNHAPVREELQKLGHRYHTRCDTETLIHAYEEWGPKSIERFRGMFAYALWDKKHSRLFCVRDRLGKKPFYYYWDGKLFAFASEIKALLEHPSISARFNESTLAEYLGFGYVSDERTLFSGIRKLMPGHWLELDMSGIEPRLRIEQYWDPPAQTAPSQASEQELIAETRRRLEETVRMRLMSDVPLGMFLSGGVDSSAIASITSRLNDGKLQTFSVGYAEAAYSELGYAKQVADTLKSEHREVRVSRDQFFDALPRLIWHEDEPITWPSSIPLYFVAKLASEHVKVVLTGEGADELFGGYGRYHFYGVNRQWLERYQVLPAFLRDAIRAQVKTNPLLGSNLRRKLGHTFIGRGESLESLYLDNFYSAFSGHEQERLLKQPGDIYGNFRRYYPNDSGSLGQLLYADQKTYLIELLMKQDQMSMAASIESRVPFLDHTFVEFAATVPDDLKVRNGNGKYILKRAVEGLLPDEIIYRKKMGFPTPLRDWLRNVDQDGLRNRLLDPQGLLADHLDLHELGRLLERHQAGQEDATDRIWRLMNLQVWSDVFLTGTREPVSAGQVANRA